jgi:hypothetical protein
MLNEIRFALRSFAKTPAFTLIAVATLALAIGANTAVLSLVNALLIRPLPYQAPQDLVLLLEHFKTQNLERIPVSPPEFIDYESRAQSFERLGAFGYANFNLANGDKPERIAGATVTAAVFPLLGVAPAAMMLSSSASVSGSRGLTVILEWSARNCSWMERASPLSASCRGASIFHFSCSTWEQAGNSADGPIFGSHWPSRIRS